MKPPDKVPGQVEGGAHGRLAVRDRFKPDRKLDCLVEHPAGAVVHLPGPLFDAEWVPGHLANRHEFLPSQRPSQRWRYPVAVADDADVEAVQNQLALGITQDKRLQQPVDGIGDAIGLLLARAAHRKDGPWTPTDRSGTGSR